MATVTSPWAQRALSNTLPAKDLTWFATYTPDDEPRIESVDEVEPTCDLCGEPDGPGEPDWNGETGNHLSCERDTFTFADALALRGL
jgi:hypothetical protein